MKLEKPKNSNYAATVVRVHNLVQLANCDNVVGLPLFGMQAIVGKDTQLGELGILFPTEVQLNEEYCSANNLFRHSELNVDTTKKGYLEDNRRVKALKFRGHSSNALWMPLSSLTYLGIHDFTPFKEGVEFDTIDGNEICRKYELPVKGQARGANAPKSRIPNRVAAKQFPEQDSITHFLKVVDSLDQNTPIIVTQKLHGTNIRAGNVRVHRKLNWLERIARRLGVNVQEFEYDMVYGSHHVVKDSNNVLHQHYYEEDVWTNAGHRMDGLIPRGMVVYGELIGYTGSGRPLQSNYTYDCAPGTNRIVVYRITSINEDGHAVDLAWSQVKELCKLNNWQHAAELLGRGTKVSDLVKLLPLLEDCTFVNMPSKWDWVDTPIAVCEQSPCDEGIVVRIEGLQPQLYKIKWPMYLQHETTQLDTGEPDIESSESDGSDTNAT